MTMLKNLAASVASRWAGPSREMPTRSLAVWAGVLAVTLCGAADGMAADLAASAARASVRAEDAKRHVAALADDALEGRAAGSRGGRAAGTYLVDEFERIGIAPAGDEGGFYQRFGTMRNVLGMLRGSDPQASQEVVVIGAHYDHVGYGTPSNSYGPTGYIHNGADDNASGVSGLLEVAEACMLLPKRPRRTIVFALWDGEEVNLLGSRHFVKQRPLPLAHHRLAFSLNLDMIGRLRAQRLEVYGSRSAVGLRRAVAAANLPTNLELAFSWEYSEDSDHFPFLDAGVPTLMFHTGLHDEYHRPSDDTHLVNFAGIEPIASLALETLLAVADAEEPPVFREACREEREVDRRRLEAEAQPAPPKRWGLGTREDQGDPTAPIVVRVTPETPAARGGVLIGDRLLAINDQPLVNQADMVRKLGDAPDEVTVTIDRQGRLLSLQLVATP
ncbi:MAG: M20/M25/M40 family metallo-hydrolase [Pirellulales bacterium]|jgi:hypothetical protein|nr:M20/M25/M40 family metallo-hydrolase [Pirellulales bacterium]